MYVLYVLLWLAGRPRAKFIGTECAEKWNRNNRSSTAAYQWHCTQLYASVLWIVLNCFVFTKHRCSMKNYKLTFINFYYPLLLHCLSPLEVNTEATSLCTILTFINPNFLKLEILMECQTGSFVDANTRAIQRFLTREFYRGPVRYGL